ncbi:MAG: hypothetical protein RL757_2935 [Bacteroidota bacterium]|jgi:hypothetical protein
MSCWRIFFYKKMTKLKQLSSTFAETFEELKETLIKLTHRLTKFYNAHSLL